MSNLLAVAIGGATGSVMRYFITLLFTRQHTFPYGTLLVNVTGSFLVGLLMAYFLKNTGLNDSVKLLLVTGFCGGFTTFSALQWEMFTLLREGRLGLAFSYIVVSFIAGLVAVYVGFKTLY